MLVGADDSVRPKHFSFRLRLWRVAFFDFRKGGVLPRPSFYCTCLDRPSVGGDAHAAKQVPLGCIAPYATALPWHISPSVKTFGFATSATLRRTTQCEHWAASQRGRGEAAPAGAGDGFPRQSADWLGMTGQEQGTGTVNGCRGRCGHRPLRNRKEGGGETAGGAEPLPYGRAARRAAVRRRAGVS